MFSRRRFLQSSSIVSLAPVLPQVIGQTANAASPRADEKVLIVIQLDGGNDGLNTVVPFEDDNYARARKKLRIPSKDLLKLDDQTGLHPSMKGAKELFDDDSFAIVQNVGYPNPDRSHFRSMKIWQTARLDDDQHDNDGWLGRTLDQKSFTGKRSAIYVGREETPVALWGRNSEAISLSRAKDLHLALQPTKTRSSKSVKPDLEQFVTRQVLQAYESAKDFEQKEKATQQKSDSEYPQSRLGQQLKLVSRLLKSGSRTRVFYTSQSGYDTHSAQLFTHASLLREYAGAVKAFHDDLKNSKLDDRVVVLTFSEFGRRIAENGSEGTDHGVAGPVFLAGSPVKGGVIGQVDLESSSNGDVAVEHDFRSVYSTILKQWLEIDPESVLGERFEALPLFS